MKRSITILLLVMCLIFGVFGCSNAQDSAVKTHKAFTFSVDTGDKIRVELDTTDGFDISSNLPFEISQNGSVLSQGIFIEADDFESYSEAVNTDMNARVIESSSKDLNQYVFWLKN